jgi:hypothetical protein
MKKQRDCCVDEKDQKIELKMIKITNTESGTLPRILGATCRG